jgi:hypothetical protein
MYNTLYSFLRRVITWIKKPWNEKSRLFRYRFLQLFESKKNKIVALSLQLNPDGDIFNSYRPHPPLQLSYQPDSHVTCNRHPEFDTLYDRFIANNYINNGGDISRLWCLILNIKNILDEGVPGHFAELGVWRGNTAAILAHYAGLSERKLFLFDTFKGFDDKDLVGIDASKPKVFSDTSLKMVHDVLNENVSICEFVIGHFPSSIDARVNSQTFSIVSLDCDLYEPMKAGLEFFYPKMSAGGIFLIHDYSSGQWPGSKTALDEFCKKTGNSIILMPDKSGSAFFRKPLDRKCH